MWYRFDVSWKKLLYSSLKADLKLYDFNIVDGEFSETNTKRSGSRFRGLGRDVAKNMLTMNQTTGKTIIQLI